MLGFSSDSTALSIKLEPFPGAEAVDIFFLYFPFVQRDGRWSSRKNPRTPTSTASVAASPRITQNRQSILFFPEFIRLHYCRLFYFWLEENISFVCTFKLLVYH